MSRRPWILIWGVSFITLLVFDAPLGFAQRVTFDQQRARESSPKEQLGGRAPWLMNRGLGQLLPQPSLRGIEKKDIRRGMVIARPAVRLVFLYDDAEVPDGLAAALARVTTPEVVAKIAPPIARSASIGCCPIGFPPGTGGALWSDLCCRKEKRGLRPARLCKKRVRLFLLSASGHRQARLIRVSVRRS